MTDQVKDIDKLFKDGHQIDLALRQGVREALQRQRQLGRAVIIWRDGKVVKVPPQEPAE